MTKHKKDDSAKPPTTKMKIRNPENVMKTPFKGHGPGFVGTVPFTVIDEKKPEKKVPGHGLSKAMIARRRKVKKSI